MRRLHKTLAGAAGAWLTLWTLGAGAASEAAGACPIPQPPDHAFSATAAADSAEGRNDLLAWTRDEALAPAAHGLQVEAVAAILAEIGRPPPPRASWWDELLARLSAWLERNARDSAAPAWLRDWLGALSPDVIVLVLWLLLCVLVVGLGGIVIMELRAAGVGRRRHPAAAAAGTGAAVGTMREHVPTLDEVAALPLRAQPAALLRLAIRRLAARELLPADDSLTNRELLARLEARAVPEAAPFRLLALGAETAVYGVREPRPEDLEVLRGAAAALGARA